jgi:hypothetical protein
MPRDTVRTEELDAGRHRARRRDAQAGAVVVSILIARCGSTSDEAAKPKHPTTPPPAQTSPSASPCGEPDGQEKFALRFRVRAHDRELHDEPWALVRKGRVNFMAAEIDQDVVNVPMVVLVSFPVEGRYLAGMKAINGTARAFTDLPHGGNNVPKGGEQALGCMAG